jgi:hypothetical protein
MSHFFHHRDTETPRKTKRSILEKFLVLFLTLCLCVSVVRIAWAGGDPSDGHSHDHEEEAVPTVTSGGATQTESSCA